MIIAKVTKNQGFTISVEDRFFEKPEEGEGVQIDPPPSRFRVNLFKIEFFSDFWHNGR